MVTATQRRNAWLLNLLALLLAFPAIYVIIISILKYGLNIHGPFDASAPVLESWGIKEPPGWNINLLILLGPIAAVILAAVQVVRLETKITREQFHARISIIRKGAPIAIGLLSLLVMATLFVYMVGENCNHGC